MQLPASSANDSLCTRLDSCFTCLRQDGCGWCMSDNICIPGDIWGPLTNVSCTDNWNFADSQCYFSRIQVFVIALFAAIFIFVTLAACTFFTCYRLRKQRLIAQEYVKLFSEYPSYQALNPSSHSVNAYTLPFTDARWHEPLNQPSPDHQQATPIHLHPTNQRRHKRLENYASFAGEEPLIKRTTDQTLTSPNTDASSSQSSKRNPSPIVGVRWNKRRDDLMHKYTRTDSTTAINNSNNDTS